MSINGPSSSWILAGDATESAGDEQRNAYTYGDGGTGKPQAGQAPTPALKPALSVERQTEKLWQVTLAFFASLAADCILFISF